MYAEVLEGALREAEIEASGFAKFAAPEGRAQLATVMQEAHGRGVFGVPSFVLDGELFWGREHLPLISERLAAGV